jgi:hypothetical protein
MAPAAAAQFQPLTGTDPGAHHCEADEVIFIILRDFERRQLGIEDDRTSVFMYEALRRHLVLA